MIFSLLFAASFTSTVLTGIDAAQTAEGYYQVNPGTNRVITVGFSPEPTVPDDVAWFTADVFIETKTAAFGTRMRLVLVDEEGKEISSESFKFNTPRECWCTALSEKIYPRKLKGLRARRIEFDFGTEAPAPILFKAPIIHAGNTHDPKMLAAAQGQRNVQYGRMARVRPVQFLRGEYEGTLELDDGFQRAPFWKETKLFRFREQDKLVNPEDADAGFDVPPLPKGVYGARLICRDKKTKTIMKEVEFDYLVLSSPIKTKPQMSIEAELTFEPEQKNWVFTNGCVRGVSTVATHFRLEEASGYRSRSCREKPEILAEGEIAAGGALDIKLPHDAYAGGRGFYLVLEQRDTSGRVLNRLTRTVALADDEVIEQKENNEGEEDARAALKRLFGHPVVATGHLGARVTFSDDVAFFKQTKEEGAYDYVVTDGMWSEDTAPVPDFHAWYELERRLQELARLGLKAGVHGSSTMNQPKWARYLKTPDRVKDGRFLASHYNCWSIAGEHPSTEIKSHILALGKRYGHDPRISFWEFWGWYGEGFSTDWWLSWQFGGGQTGVGNKIEREFYEKFLPERFRPLSNKPIGVFYYNPSPLSRFWQKNPGFFLRNGGNEGKPIRGKERMFHCAWAGAPVMSEDVAVYGDTIDHWERNLTSGTLIGGLGIHFFNYDIYETQAGGVKKEKNHDAIAAWFAKAKKERFPVLAKKPLEVGDVAVINFSQASLPPLQELYEAGFKLEPLNGAWLSRLKHCWLAFGTDITGIRSKETSYIRSWIRRGGIFVTTPTNAAFMAQMGFPLPKGTRLFQDLKSGRPRITTEVGSVFPERAMYPTIHPWEHWLFEENAYPKAERIQSFTGGPDNCAGHPASFAFKLGKGQLILLNSFHGADILAKQLQNNRMNEKAKKKR